MAKSKKVVSKKVSGVGTEVVDNFEYVNVKLKGGCNITYKKGKINQKDIYDIHVDGREYSMKELESFKKVYDFLQTEAEYTVKDCIGYYNKNDKQCGLCCKMGECLRETKKNLGMK